MHAWAEYGMSLGWVQEQGQQKVSGVDEGGRWNWLHFLWFWEKLEVERDKLEEENKDQIQCEPYNLVCT